MANINVQYSQSVVDQNHALDLATSSVASLSSIFDSFVGMNYAINKNYYYFTSYNYSGNTLTTNFANGASLTYTGTISNPNAYSGTASVSNISFNLPNYFTVSGSGLLNYNWQVSQSGALPFYTTSGNVQSYNIATKYPTNSSYYDSAIGNSSMSLNGNINYDSSGNMSGTISSISTSTDNFVKSLVIKGIFQVSGNTQSIGQNLTDCIVSGNLTSYSEDYYDGSYLHVANTGDAVYLKNKQAIDVELLSDPNNFSGHDTISIDLPSVVYEKWIISSGAGNDVISIKGAGSNLAVNAGSGDDVISVLDRGHAIDGGENRDIVVYGSQLSSYAIDKNTTSISISNSSGKDTLTNVERLQFSDAYLGFDTNILDSSGETALLIGAVLPGQLAFDVSKRELLGNVIELFDEGYTIDQLSGALMRLPIWDVLTGKSNYTNSDIASYLWTNVHGSAPTNTELNSAVNALNSQTGSSQGLWLSELAQSSANQVHIDLVGIQNHGLIFY